MMCRTRSLKKYLILVATRSKRTCVARPYVLTAVLYILAHTPCDNGTYCLW